MDNSENKPIEAPLDLSKEENKKGLALKKWSTFFFVLSCIATFLIGASLALPFFLVVLGIVSIICWLVVIVFFTIITIGLIWTSDTTKRINGSWMSFNEMLFNSGTAASEFAIKAFPIMSIVGASIILFTWLFIIFGFITNKKRQKFYKAMLIVLGIITLIYIVITVISAIIISKQVPAQSASNSAN